MPRCEHYDYCYSYVINGMILCSKNHDFKEPTNMNKYIKISKILIKKSPDIRPLNSIAFKGVQQIHYVMPRCEHYDYCYSYVINGMILCLKKYDFKKSTNMNNCTKITKIKKNT